MNKRMASSAARRQTVEVIKVLLLKVIVSKHFSVALFIFREPYLIYCPV